MNAVHVAVIRNKVLILKKLADAGAGMDMHINNVIICLYVTGFEKSQLPHTPYIFHHQTIAVHNN